MNILLFADLFIGTSAAFFITSFLVSYGYRDISSGAPLWMYVGFVGSLCYAGARIFS